MASDFGDLIRALCLLDANSSAGSRRAMAGALGIDLLLPDAAEKKASGKSADVGQPPRVPPAITNPSPSAPRNTIPAKLRFLDEAPAAQVPTWLEGAAMLPQPASTFRAVPAKPSLLTPGWTRGVLISVLATIFETQEIDLPRLIAGISSRAVFDDLPLACIPTLARGVHCWIDDGPAMEPFLQDQRQLLFELKKVAGLSRVSENRFRGFPERRGNFLKGVPHLILSDLGAMRLPDDYLPDAVAVDAWIEFAGWVQDHLDSRLVVLTPLPVKKYPMPLRKAAIMLNWDRKTSVQTARQALAGIL
jgi:hypothetical protein